MVFWIHLFILFYVQTYKHVYFVCVRPIILQLFSLVDIFRLILRIIYILHNVQDYIWNGNAISTPKRMTRKWIVQSFVQIRFSSQLCDFQQKRAKEEKVKFLKNPLWIWNWWDFLLTLTNQSIFLHNGLTIFRLEAKNKPTPILE